MAMYEESDQLSGRQIVRLAGIVPRDIMESLSIKYMDTTTATVEDLRRKTRTNELEFNRSIIRSWLNRNPDNQRQVCNINRCLTR